MNESLFGINFGFKFPWVLEMQKISIGDIVGAILVFVLIFVLVLYPLKLFSKQEARSEQYKKRTIPKPLREQVWRKYFGNSTDGVCQGICKPRNKITAFHFECGHIYPESRGGETAVENLIPLCSYCNKSLGSNDFRDWKKKYD